MGPIGLRRTSKSSGRPEKKATGGPSHPGRPRSNARSNNRSRIFRWVIHKYESKPSGPVLLPSSSKNRSLQVSHKAWTDVDWTRRSAIQRSQINGRWTPIVYKGKGSDGFDSEVTCRAQKPLVFGTRTFHLSNNLPIAAHCLIDLKMATSTQSVRWPNGSETN